MSDEYLTAPVDEVELYQGLFYNKTIELSTKYIGDPFRYMKEVSELIRGIYNAAYRPGYTKRVVDEAVKNPDNE